MGVVNCDVEVSIGRKEYSEVDVGERPLRRRRM